MAHGVGDSGNQQGASSLLAAERDTIVRRWGAVSEAPTSVLIDVVDGLVVALSGDDELGDDELIARLTATAGALPADDIGSLRSIVHHLCIDRLERAEATRAVAAVSAVLDGVIERRHTAEVAHLESAALTDVLTGAGNRRALEREFAQMRGAAARHGEPIALVLIDLDGLKGINDRMGHPAGDAALCRLASGLTSEPRGADAVYRLGGDEFVLLLPSTDLEGAQEVLKRLPADLPKFSYGVASAPIDGDDLPEVLDVADQRLLEAKAGRWHAVPVAPGVDTLSRRTSHLVGPTVGALTLSAVVLTASIAAGRVEDVTATMAMQAIAISSMSLAAVGLLSRAAPLHRALAAGPVALGLWLALGVGSTTSPITPQAQDRIDTPPSTAVAGPTTTVPSATPSPATTPLPAATPTPSPAPAVSRTAAPAPVVTPTPPPTGGAAVGAASGTDVTPPAPAPEATEEPSAPVSDCDCVEAQSAPERRGHHDKPGKRPGKGGGPNKRADAPAADPHAIPLTIPLTIAFDLPDIPVEPVTALDAAPSAEVTTETATDTAAPSAVTAPAPLTEPLELAADSTQSSDARVLAADATTATTDAGVDCDPALAVDASTGAGETGTTPAG